jgi:hypothetical protein
MDTFVIDSSHFFDVSIQSLEQAIPVVLLFTVVSVGLEGLLDLCIFLALGKVVLENFLEHFSIDYNSFFVSICHITIVSIIMLTVSPLVGLHC